MFLGSHFKKVLLARAKDVHHRFKPTEYKSASSLGIKKFSTTLVVMEKLKIAVIGKYLILTCNTEVGTGLSPLVVIGLNKFVIFRFRTVSVCR